MASHHSNALQNNLPDRTEAGHGAEQVQSQQLELADLADLLDILHPPTQDFSGHLVLSSQEVNWTLTFVKGQFIYALDDQCDVRRWDRLAKQYLPNWEWQQDAAQASECKFWPLQLLERGLSQRKISLIRVKLVIRQIAQECFFELSQYSSVSFDWEPVPFSNFSNFKNISLSKWEILTTFSRIRQMQQQWQMAGLKQLSPTLAPRVEPSVEAHLLPVERHYLEGSLTLREISNQTQEPLVELAQSLMALAEQGALTFQILPDRIRPAAHSQPLPAVAVQQSTGEVTPQAEEPTSQLPTESTDSEPHMIACIDDSPVLAYRLKQILVSAGYRALTIQEPMRGFSELIEHRPALILLDLMLPNADGYSICRFLRDTPVFARTPIIVLTGQSKPVDRAKARLAGATEFLVKPPNPEQLLEMIRMHLNVTLRA